MALRGDELDLALPEEGFVHAGLHRTQGPVGLCGVVCYTHLLGEAHNERTIDGGVSASP